MKVLLKKHYPLYSLRISVGSLQRLAFCSDGIHGEGWCKRKYQLLISLCKFMGTKYNISLPNQQLLQNGTRALDQTEREVIDTILLTNFCCKKNRVMCLYNSGTSREVHLSLPPYPLQQPHVPLKIKAVFRGKEERTLPRSQWNSR